MITVPEKIEIRKAPLGGKLLKETEENIRCYFNVDNSTLDTADNLYRDFFGRSMHGKYKAEKIENAVDDFLFSAAGSFEKWFSSFTPEAQRIIYAVTFEEFVYIDTLEKALNINIKTINEKWHDKRLDHDYNLKFISISRSYNDFYFFRIKPLYRAALLPQFTPPPEALLENCVCGEEPGAAVYNNSAEIAEPMHLLCEAVNEILSDTQTEKNFFRPFTKKDIGKLYTSSGFLPFPFETEKALAPYSPAAADLLARFMLLLTKADYLPASKNAVETLRAYLKKFFGLTDSKNKNNECWVNDTIEYGMFFGHLNKAGIFNYYYRMQINIFYLRHTLMNCLFAIAEDGRAFDAAALVKQLKYSGKWCSLFAKRELEYLKIKANKIYIFEKEISKESWEYFRPEYTLYFDFIEKPLLLGYFYLCASLGILEITQSMPPLTCEYSGKKTPFSVFDSLKTVKVTEFGRWCLGLSDKLPEMKKSKYEAIADNELFLVTVSGKSLEHTIFLDRIGEKLGEDRWRINPSTLISGCENKSQIEDRINKFHRLIDPNPAPHWEKLFKTALDRTNFLDNQSIDALVYQLPFDSPEKREISAELLAAPELSGIAMRAEGGLLVVPFRNEKRFYALLAAHGIAHFGT
ncbi:MAG: hypothetical protein LBB47_05385 [Spirochaetaceae bacterium]|jgi:hypothetical protein|nr:hypothetical protein [Spirochaetaceae bacterium]